MSTDEFYPDPNYKLSENFTYGELIRSRIAMQNRIDNQPELLLLDNILQNALFLCRYILQPLRSYYVEPIHITSWFRCPALNKRIGGKTKSQHLTGQAADIFMGGYNMMDVFKKIIMLKLPYDQVIYEERIGGNRKCSQFVHVSFDVNIQRKEALVSTEYGKYEKLSKSRTKRGRNLTDTDRY